MAVFKPGMDHKGAYYLYFWVKLASRAVVEAQRREAFLSGAPDADGFVHPQRIGVVPKDNDTSSRAPAPESKLPALNVVVGCKLDMAAAERHGHVLDLRMMQPGITLQTAERWIHEPADQGGGAEWAKGAYCVLCHVMLEAA